MKTLTTITTALTEDSAREIYDDLVSDLPVSARVRRDGLVVTSTVDLDEDRAADELFTDGLARLAENIVFADRETLVIKVVELK